MGTLKGFPNPPALWRRRDGSRPKAARGRVGWVWSQVPTKSAGEARLRLRDVMGTLKGFPNPPALWLPRAKPGSAYAM